MCEWSLSALIVTIFGGTEAGTSVECAQIDASLSVQLWTISLTLGVLGLSTIFSSSNSMSFILSYKLSVAPLTDTISEPIFTPRP